MGPERWRRIDALYAAALEQPPEARDAFVQEAAGDDADLYHEVCSLLQSEGAAERALERPAAEAASLLASLPAELSLEIPAALPADTRSSPLAAGERIGPYRLVAEIARGGMGAVYLAERADEQFEQRVALKLVKRGMDSAEILRRFRHERQILASLEHPHIARLLDGGVSDEGQPYLVMEYIPGQPIDRYCDERGLGVEARLALFEAVCEAVQYAHQKLVVHRDLKPSNILVDQQGTVKLLDFGIAKLLSEEEDAAPHTRTGMRVLTPEYASPEQLRAEPITTASDVYSLGVVLYRLLTGRPPYRAPGRPGYERERATLEQEAERPSAAIARPVELAASADRPEPSTHSIAAARGTTPEGLRRRLRGDLDSIVLKALEKEPAERYGSVEQLLADLRRHRSGLPVTAHSASLRYRTGKFVRRHRRAVAAAALFLVLLLGFAAAMTLQQRETARERDRAGQERDKAEEVTAFLESLLAASDPFLPEAERLDTLRVRDFLARGAARVRHELGGQPLVQARMLDVLGRVYRNLGMYGEARPLLQEAVRIRRSALSDRDPDLAKSLAELGALLLQEGDHEAAQQLLLQALAVNTRGLGANHPEVAGNLNDLGAVLRERGLYEEARNRHLAALEILEKRGDERTDLQRAATLNDLVLTLQRASDYAEAERYARASVELHRQLYGPEHPQLALVLRELGLLLQRRGDYQGAEAGFREALAIAERRLDSEHPRVADLLNRLASVRWWQGDLDAADSLHRRSLDLKRRLYGPAHVEVAYGLNNLASVLRDKREFDAAEALHREALTIVRTTLGEAHSVFAILTANHATTLSANADCGAAVPLFRTAIATMKQTIPADRYRIPSQQRWLGSCLTRLGQYAEAEAALLESHRAFLEARGADDSFTRSVAEHLVTLYTAWGRPDQAAAYRASP